MGISVHSHSIYRCNPLDDFVFCKRGADAFGMGFGYFYYQQFLFISSVNPSMVQRLLLILLLLSNGLYSQTTHKALVEFMKGKNPLVDRVLNDSSYQFQYILTEINSEDTDTTLHTLEHITPEKYFYPASVVKLPTALVALEKLNQLQYPLNTVIRFNADQNCGNMQWVKQTQTNQQTFEQLISELIIVSNNHYYNTLYHFCSPRDLNASLAQKGLTNTHLYKDFSGCEFQWGLTSNSYTLYTTQGKLLARYPQEHLPLKEVAQHYEYSHNKLIGEQHEYRKNIVDGPYDFNYNLEYSLNDIHSTLLRLMYPSAFAPEDRWQIRNEDRLFLINAMQATPSSLGGTFLNSKKYPDNLYKYAIHGAYQQPYRKVITTSKIGISYGFVTETAHIYDPESDISFALTTSIYVNQNRIVNDGNYEYKTIARPFLAAFAQLLLEFEKQQRSTSGKE